MTDETKKIDEAETADTNARTAELERRLADLESRSTAKIIAAELKAEAALAGMIDLDGIKLIDMEKLRLNESGELEDRAVLIAELRRSKPWLFGVPSSSSAANPPPARPPRQKSATEMSYKEWQAARQELLRRH